MDKKKLEFLVLGGFILMAVVFLINVFIARYERNSANAVNSGAEVRKIAAAEKTAEPAKKAAAVSPADEPDTNTQTLPGGALLQ